MTTIDFPEQNTVIAKDQPEYFPIPAHFYPVDPEGRVAFCWQLTWTERLILLVTGRLWQQILTFNKPLQPQKLTVDKPFFP